MGSMEKQQAATRKQYGIRFDDATIELLKRVSERPGTEFTGQTRTWLIEYAIQATFSDASND